MTQLDELQQSTDRLVEVVGGLCEALGDGATGLAAQITAIANDVAAIKRVRNRAVMYFVLAVLFSVAAFVGSGLISHHEISAVKESKFQSCLARNAESVSNANGIRAQFMPDFITESKRSHPDPVLLSILGELAHYQPITVLCSK